MCEEEASVQYHTVCETKCVPCPPCRATWSVACSTHAWQQRHTWQRPQSVAWRMRCRVLRRQQHLATRWV
jgi:hypothetical protein